MHTAKTQTIHDAQLDCTRIELALADGTILRLPPQNLAALIAALRVLRGERLELPCGESRHA